MHTKPSRQIVGLDLIRAFAAAMVMLFHLGYFNWTKGSDPNATMPSVFAPLAPVLSAGWVGVEIFFVLSGFVIAYSTEGATATRFFQHRVNRLLPTALICATMTACVLLTAYSFRQVSEWWLRSVTFSPVGPWVDGTYWTLSVEVAFYALVFAVLLVRKGHYLSAVTAVVAIVSTAVCVLCAFPALGTPASFLRFASAASFPPLACLLLVHGSFFYSAFSCFSF